ncbi:MAG: diphthine synthase [Candidatus Marsarchaeota archaeon]|nr:diphthine synthase [Candidatus Marsarchaeota archaeon]
MLYLIGVGLADGDVPVAALDACKRCTLYADTYTSLMNERRIAYLEALLSKKITELKRSDMEENAPALVKRAASEDIAVLVGGDPLTATTHKILFIEARKAGVSVKIMHASSILSVIIGESGLDFYRFGAVCTVPRWSEKYRPVSFYETIERNSRSNLHSIVLLDYDAEKGSSIPLQEALDVFWEAELHYRHGIIANERKIFVMHDLGRDGQSVLVLGFGEAKALKLNNGVTSIIVPAEITDVERETVAGMHGVKA